MQVLVVGSSPAWPNPGSAHAGYLVDDRLLLDCGPGVLGRLRERWAWPPVEAIVITHLHLDHWGDLVPWVWATQFGPGSDAPQVDLWVPSGSRGELAALGERLGTANMFEQAFWLREYEDRVPFRVLGYDLVAIRVPHYDRLTFAVRVSNGHATVAYSGDSAPAAELAEIARDADLFLCEATLEHGAEQGKRGHLAADEAVAAARSAGAGRLVLTHRPSELAAPEGVELAYDGLELSV